MPGLHVYGPQFRIPAQRFRMTQGRKKHPNYDGDRAGEPRPKREYRVTPPRPEPLIPEQRGKPEPPKIDVTDFPLDEV